MLAYKGERKKNERYPIIEELATVKLVGGLGKKRTRMIVEELEIEMKTKKGARKSLTPEKKISEKRQSQG
jgi:hypothetical protein